MAQFYTKTLKKSTWTTLNIMEPPFWYLFLAKLHDAIGRLTCCDHNGKTTHESHHRSGKQQWGEEVEGLPSNPKTTIDHGPPAIDQAFQQEKLYNKRQALKRNEWQFVKCFVSSWYIMHCWCLGSSIQFKCGWRILHNFFAELCCNATIRRCSV